MQKEPRTKSIVFTVNNWTERIYSLILNFARQHATYAIIGKEIGYESELPHLQGFMQLAKPIRWGRLASEWSAYIQTAKGSAAANRRYCSKEGDFIEIGSAPSEVPTLTERYRNALEHARNDTLDLLAAEDPVLFTRYYMTYLDVRNRSLPKPNILSDLDNFWFWGATGTGKTSKAFSKFGESLYIKTRNKWWCEYHGEETVLIDEVDESDATWMGTFLKNWADRYPFRAEVKRSSILIRPLRIVVTSNWSIKELWPEKRDHEALLRKFQAVHFKPFK